MTEILTFEFNFLEENKAAQQTDSYLHHKQAYSLIPSFLLASFAYKMITFINIIDILSLYVWGKGGGKKNHLQINMIIYAKQFWRHICNITPRVAFVLP